jgi:starvation-inducible outer membrane lipoprotein
MRGKTLAGAFAIFATLSGCAAVPRNIPGSKPNSIVDPVFRPSAPTKTKTKVQSGNTSEIILDKNCVPVPNNPIELNCGS